MTSLFAVLFKTVTFLAGLAFFSCVSPPQTDGPDELALQMKENLILVKLTVNGKQANFIVDTGASVSVIDQRQASKYEFRCFDNMNQGSMNSMAGVSSLILTSKIELSHHNHQFGRMKFYASDMGYINRFMKERHVYILGILGADFLKRNQAVIDYKHKRIVLNGRMGNLETNLLVND